MSTAVVSTALAAGLRIRRPLTFRSRGGESDQGCRRRPKTKYEIDRTPAELTTPVGSPMRRWFSVLAAGQEARPAQSHAFGASQR